MNQLNSLIIEGNVVKNAETKEPKKGFEVCTFSVAVNRWYKDKNGEGVSEVSFIDVESYGKLAESAGRKAEKGRGVRVVGRIKQDRWKDKDGKSYSRVYVVAEHIEYKPKFNAEAESTQEKASESQVEYVPSEVMEEAVF